MVPNTNQNVTNHEPKESLHSGATHSAPPSSQDLSCLTYPTKEPTRDTLKTSAKNTAESHLSTADFSAHKTSETLRDMREYDGGGGITLTPFDKLSNSMEESFKNGDFVRGIANSAVVAGMLASTVMCGGLEYLGLSQGFSAPSMMSGLFYGGVGLVLASGVSSAITYGVWRAAHEYRRVTGQTTATWAEAIPADSLETDAMVPLPVWLAGIKSFGKAFQDIIGQ